jgi:hypothetical protein
MYSLVDVNRMSGRGAFFGRTLCHALTSRKLILLERIQNLV